MVTVSSTWNCVTATLDDGRRVSHTIANMAGFVGQPMTRADVERKFRSNVGKRWSAERRSFGARPH